MRHQHRALTTTLSLALVTLVGCISSQSSSGPSYARQRPSPAPQDDITLNTQAAPTKLDNQNSSPAPQDDITAGQNRARPNRPTRQNRPGRKQGKPMPDRPAHIPPPNQQDPTIPMQGYYPKFPQAWKNFHQQHLKQAQSRPEVVLLGDSLTQGWRKHKPLWQQHFGTLKTANFGMGGDRTQQLLWRINNGLFDQMRPQLVVLNIGVNNLWGDTFGPERIVAGIETVVDAIQTKSPQTKVLLIGILPAGKNPQGQIRRKIQTINGLAARLDHGDSVRFVDVGAEFVAADGSLQPAMLPDNVHLSKEGYQIWANSIKDPIYQMITP